MRAGDSYLERPCDGWSVVYGLHSITVVECLSTTLAVSLRASIGVDDLIRPY